MGCIGQKRSGRHLGKDIPQAAFPLGRVKHNIKPAGCQCAQHCMYCRSAAVSQKGDRPALHTAGQNVQRCANRRNGGPGFSPGISMAFVTVTGGAGPACSGVRQQLQHMVHGRSLLFIKQICGCFEFSV